ncbi:MAG: hypothetical protein L0Y62_03785, partial [Nitrospirae bacterium]|nr:hypothetical protein [Nitrospirota bacterium]
MIYRFLILFFLLSIFPSEGICLTNLVPNPDFNAPQQNGAPPHFWTYQKNSSSAQLVIGQVGKPLKKALGIMADKGNGGEWRCKLSNLVKGKKYIISLRVYAEPGKSGINPAIELFGKRTILDYNKIGAWQDFSINFEAKRETSTLKFINRDEGNVFFSSPAILDIEEMNLSFVPSPKKIPSMLDQKTLPFILMTGNLKDISLAKKLGFKGFYISGFGTDKDFDLLNVKENSGILIVDLPDDENATRGLINRLSGQSDRTFGWHIEAGHILRVLEKSEFLKRMNNNAPVFLSVADPDLIDGLKEFWDFFIIRQDASKRPPLTALNAAVEKAKSYSEGKGLGVVINIADDKAGDYKEIKAAIYLSIIHGIDALFFSPSERDMTALNSPLNSSLNSPGIQNLMKELIGEMRLIKPIFEMERLHKVDFNYDVGKETAKPVHALMLRGKDRLYMLATNISSSKVRGTLTGIEEGAGSLFELFSGKTYEIKGAAITDEFRPYQT